MPDIYKFMHSIQDADDLSKDRYVNVFHFSGPTGSTTTALETMGSAVMDFYRVVNTPAGHLASYYSSQVGGTIATVKSYLVDLQQHHDPLTVQTYTFPAETTGVDNLPAEVALVLSLKSTIPTIISPKRTRGRLYVGPLNTLAGSGTGVQQASRPNTVFRTAMNDAAQRLYDAAIANAFSWVIYSPTQADDAQAQVAFSITEVSVDDAWDTQRRRGVGPTVRTKNVLTA